MKKKWNKKEREAYGLGRRRARAGRPRSIPGWLDKSLHAYYVIGYLKEKGEDIPKEYQEYLTVKPEQAPQTKPNTLAFFTLKKNRTRVTMTKIGQVFHVIVITPQKETVKILTVDEMDAEMNKLESEGFVAK